MRLFVGVAEQAIEPVSGSSRNGGLQQLLRKDNSCSKLRAISTRRAAAHIPEAIAGRDYPRILRWPAKIAAEILEKSRVRRCNAREVIEGFVNASGQTCGRNIVAEDTVIDDLPEECALRQQRFDQSGNVLLTVGRKRLFIA